MCIRDRSTFDAFEDVEKYATVVDIETIKENDCNLNISRYVDTTEAVSYTHLI